MVDGSAAIGRSTVLADVLDTPITKLTVGNDIDTGEDFVDARALQVGQQGSGKVEGF